MKELVIPIIIMIKEEMTVILGVWNECSFSNTYKIQLIVGKKPVNPMKWLDVKANNEFQTTKKNNEKIVDKLKNALVPMLFL